MPTRSDPVRTGVLPFVLLGTSLLAGCHSIGPATVARDRSDYSSSISESWKRQTLLNIVKLRYFDPPIFVDVGQIVAGYSLETTLNAGGQISSGNAIQGNSALFGASGRFTDRPTITYTPLTGNKFVKALMTPLTPESVFFLIQAGWPADGVLMAAVASLNGLKNQENSVAGVTPPDPDFVRALELLRNIQRSGAVSLRVQQDAEKKEMKQTSLLTFRSKEVSATTLAEIRELRQLLRLDQEATEFTLVFGGTSAHDKEVAVLTRSLLHIMGTMAAQVDVPPGDIAQGRATPGLPEGADPAQPGGLLRIHSSSSKPADAAVAVSYRDAWFWIDDRDLKSKRAFAFMLILFTLADTGEKESLPLITIPAQ
ncbi:MAG TPA: hypothetical protein VNH84_04660 [Candidatus Saccharimonadales bacterium]|nr:hypothetical protein [Candidatus Saccharimonadales bacterium]